MVLGIKNPWKRKEKVKEADLLEKAGFHVEKESDAHMRIAKIHDDYFRQDEKGQLLGEAEPIPEGLINTTSMPYAAPGVPANLYMEVYMAWQSLVRIQRRARVLGLKTPAIDNRIRSFGWIMEAMGFKPEHMEPRTVIALQTYPPLTYHGPPTRPASIDLSQVARQQEKEEEQEREE
jgi:hypothetical protein